ncbi:hypothetical protein KY308_03825 [Candidatus Woesearchaeota archaeon]|nr:hypothetical protein [Candidatus Woesearchaeota archaeon]
MKYNSKIEVLGDEDKIYACFATEKIDKERSNFSIKKSKGKVVFEIRAKDAAAFRATTNMITQLLAVYEKMKKI